MIISFDQKKLKDMEGDTKFKLPIEIQDIAKKAENVE